MRIVPLHDIADATTSVRIPYLCAPERRDAFRGPADAATADSDLWNARVRFRLASRATVIAASLT